MQNLLRLSAVAFTAALLSSAARADQPWPNWYVGINGSVGFLQDSDVKGSGAGTATKLTHQTGWGAGGTLGYMPATTWAPLNHMRFEGEVYYHTNDSDNLHTTGGTAASSGSMSAVSYMFNVFYDLPTGTGFSPYIGGGLGVSTIDLSKSSGLLNTGDSDTRFSYQGMVGISYTPQSVPDTIWTLGYRYLGASSPSYTTTTGKAKVDYNISDIEAGVKFRF
jgi:opacity protein-like surface antigen